MKRLIPALLALAFGASPVDAGDLNPPPGPVAPTMKTLVEVEPRVALTQENTPGTGQFQFVIDEPGSYYLTSDVTTDLLKGGIEVRTDGVTIDLNGFTMRFGGGAIGVAQGVAAIGRDDITVRNGTLDGFLFNGVEAGNRAIIEGVRAVNNGDAGILVGHSAVIRGCVASGNGEDGFDAANDSTLTDCVARENGLAGFDTRISTHANCVASRNMTNGFEGLGCAYTGCTAELNDEDGFTAVTSTLSECVAFINRVHGFSIFGASVVENCSSTSNISNGIFADNGVRISGCSVSSNSSTGIRMLIECTADGNTCRGNGLHGIEVSSRGCSVDGNTVAGNAGDGIQCHSQDSIFTRNRAHGNTMANYDIIPGNSVGTIRVTPVGAGAWDNFEY